MATGAAHGSAPSASGRDVLQARRDYERTIDRHLSRTRRQVKLIELGASSVLLLVGVLGFFLVASLIDHWVVGLGYTGRAVLLVGLLVGVALYFWRYILPLLVRSINPEYAAHAIEESTPSLKNSLLNFLLLRRSPTGVKEVVLEALEKRAATDISAVPVDAAVDRSKLIRMGYLLVGATALLGLYKIASPKDPFQTAARVLAPWADIARPSRVQIGDVQPGSAQMYIGETAKVSALVTGVREGDPVNLIYSTADGTVAEQIVPMTAAAGGRFEGSLPPDGVAGRMSSTGGLQQHTTYRIEAGDAISPDFHLNVIASPRIVVEKVDYLFPAYTRKGQQSTDRGDLKGLEGTKVTITTRANQPIKTAWIEFDPQPDGGPAETMPLRVEGDRATGVLVLQTRPDRRTAWRSAYQVRFINELQQQSHQPILHGIEVLRDLPPEVEIIAPQTREVEVPANGGLPIEVRAVDPDFGLSSLKLVGNVRRDAMLRDIKLPALIEPAEGQPPQALKRYSFQPGRFNLKAGDVVTFWAVAEDNRTAVPSVESVQGIAMPTPIPEPNIAKTEAYTIRIVAPRAGDQGGNRGDQGNEDPMEGEGQQGEEGGQQGSPMNGASGNQNNDPQNRDNQSAKDNNNSQGEKSSQGDQGGKSQSGGQSNSSESSEGSESGDSKQGKSQQGGSNSSSEKGSSGSDDGGEASQDNQGGSGSGNQAGGQQGGGNQSSGEQQDGDSSGQGQPGQSGASGKSRGGQNNNSGEQGEPMGQSSGESGSQGGSRGGAGSQKPEHDGDVFDRLLDQMQDEQGEPSGEQGGQGQGGSAQRQPAGQNKGQNSNPPNGDQMNGGQPGEGQQDQGAGAQQQPGANNAARTGEQSTRPQVAQDQPGEGSESSKDEAGQPRGNDAQGGNSKGSKSGSQGAKAGANNQPQADGSDGSPQDGNAEQGTEKSDDPQGSGKRPRSGDDAQGKGPNDQKAPGEGGRPQGGNRTDKGDPQSYKQGSGEPKDAGAGQNGDSGAGKNSTDKTGSGQGQETNRDRQKNMSDSDATPENGETSAPSGSKRQSDSKGGTSGDRSGGGSKGAGQSGGQEGNDTAGSNSAADEGAGAANETGMGETGSKGGQGEKSDGQTGSSGNEKGEGSSSRPSDAGNEKGGSPQSPSGDNRQKPPQGKSGDNGPQPGQGDPSAKEQAGDNPGSSSGQKTEGGTGPVVGGGQQGDRPKVDYGPEGPGTEADEANLEYAKKATDLVLSKLKEQEHNPDPELLDRLGMSREQMQEFVRRWDRLKSEAERDPNAARELNEALRSLGLKDPKQRKRSGGSVSDDQRNLRDSGTRIPPPSKYRDQFDAFRKGAARAGNR